MSIPKEAYQTLQSIVGTEWVSDDPAICEADRYCSLASPTEEKRRPGCSIEPATTEEVQAIVKVANRYRIPFVVTSTFYGAGTYCRKDDSMLIDLKRMNQLEIDEENLYAIVGPGVAFSALQADLLKMGLVTFVPGCGGQASVVANTVNMGDAPIGWRHGLGYQRLLGVEWVLPDGEILRMGSRAISDDYFWGDGPGPDLRGLLRGCAGHQSRLGIVTRIGVKVFPFVSEELKPEGWAYHTTMNLPPNRFKWYNIRFYSREDAINAMFEIGRCEIALVVMSVPPIFRGVARTRGVGCGGFWEFWKDAGPKLNPKQMDLRVLLYGIGSDKRLEYEEKVLLDIVKDFKGSPREAPCRDETNFMAADAICANVVGGRFSSEVSYESINQAVRYSKVVDKITDEHRPPILQEYNSTDWVCPYELGYIAKMECLRMAAVEDNYALQEWKSDCQDACAEGGAYALVPDNKVFGPVWGNYPEKEDKIREIFDPNHVSAPE
jgi:glycolate oxidase